MAYINIAEWSPEHVADWLRGLDNMIIPYVHFFLNNRIDGHHLLTLGPDDLSRLNITKIGHQELILEAVNHLRQLHYNLISENLQSLALKVGCHARSLHNEIQVLLLTGATAPPASAVAVLPGAAVVSSTSSGLTAASGSPSAVSLSGDPALLSTAARKVDTEVLVGAAELVGAIKQLVSWIDRPPFKGCDRYTKIRRTLLQLALELASTAQRDHFADNPLVFIKQKCICLAELSDFMVQEYADALVIQPASLEVVTAKKSARDDDWGMQITSKCSGVHIVGSVRYQSPVQLCAKVEEGDEIVQVNYQTVLGWSLDHLTYMLQDRKTEVTLTLKKRPRHSNLLGQIICLKPYKIPINQIGYEKQQLNVPECGFPSDLEVEPSSPRVLREVEADDEAFLPPEDGAASDQNVVSRLRSQVKSRSRTTIQRRATVSGASPTVTDPPVSFEDLVADTSASPSSAIDVSAVGAASSSGHPVSLALVSSAAAARRAAAVSAATVSVSSGSGATSSHTASALNDSSGDDKQRHSDPASFHGRHEHRLNHTKALQQQNLQQQPHRSKKPGKEHVIRSISHDSSASYQPLHTHAIILPQNKPPVPPGREASITAASRALPEAPPSAVAGVQHQRAPLTPPVRAAPPTRHARGFHGESRGKLTVAAVAPLRMPVAVPTPPVAALPSSLRKIFASRTVSPESLAPADRQGWLYVRPRNCPNKWHKRWAVLKTSYLYLFRSRHETHAACLIFLPGFMVQAAPDSSSSRHAFKLEHEATSFCLAAVDPVDAVGWQRNLREQAAGCLKPKVATFTTPTVAVAAVPAGPEARTAVANADVAATPAAQAHRAATCRSRISDAANVGEAAEQTTASGGEVVRSSVMPDRTIYYSESEDSNPDSGEEDPVLAASAAEIAATAAVVATAVVDSAPSPPSPAGSDRRTRDESDSLAAGVSSGSPTLAVANPKPKPRTIFLSSTLPRKPPPVTAGSSSVPSNVSLPTTPSKPLRHRHSKRNGSAIDGQRLADASPLDAVVSTGSTQHQQQQSFQTGKASSWLYRSAAESSCTPPPPDVTEGMFKKAQQQQAERNKLKLGSQPVGQSQPSSSFHHQLTQHLQNAQYAPPPESAGSSALAKTAADGLPPAVPPRCATSQQIKELYFQRSLWTANGSGTGGHKGEDGVYDTPPLIYATRLEALASTSGHYRASPGSAALAVAVGAPSGYIGSNGGSHSNKPDILAGTNDHHHHYYHHHHYHHQSAPHHPSQHLQQQQQHHQQQPDRRI